MYPAPTIFDEVQYAPDLLPYIKESIDERRDAHSQYFLTGSQNLLLTQQVTESLAGRAAMLRLLPVSQREEFGRPLDPLPWEPQKKHPAVNHLRPADLWKNLLRGGYLNRGAFDCRVCKIRARMKTLRSLLEKKLTFTSQRIPVKAHFRSSQGTVNT